MAPSPSSPQQPSVTLAMTDEDVVQRAALLLEATCHPVRRRRKPHHKDYFVVRIRGRRAVEVMTALTPLMGSRRQSQIRAALASRSIAARRVPYASEIAELVKLKGDGIGRQYLAQRYGITPRGLDRVLRGAPEARDLTEVLAIARRIANAEASLHTLIDGKLSDAWLAGLTEGEGSFARTSVITLSMTDQDVVTRFAHLTGSEATYVPARRDNWSPMWQARLCGSSARELASRLGPVLSARRHEQIRIMLSRAGRDRVPPDRLARNLLIARRLADGERGPALAREYGVTHQNIYYIGKRYKDKAACPSG